MKHETALKVRSYECDAYGHVNNAVYLHYLEYARGEFLQAVGFDYKAVLAAGYGLYVTRLEIDYKSPAYLDDWLSIQSWPVKKGAASGVMRQEIHRDTQLIAGAVVTWAFVNSAGVPTRIPAPWDRPGLWPEPDHQE